MTKTRVFIIMLITAAVIAIFSAGQMLLILPHPEIIFGAAILTIVLLSLGFFLGKGKKHKDEWGEGCLLGTLFYLLEYNNVWQYLIKYYWKRFTKIMETIVLKFGGSSVANNERLINVCKHIIREYDNNNKVVVVVSAQRKNNR